MDVLFRELSNQGGLLGTLLAISLIALGWSVRMLLAEKDKRITDALATRDNLVEPIGFIKDSLSLIQQKVQISKDRD